MASKAPATVLPAPLVPETQPLTKDLVYRFKVSRLAAPKEFKNLWELAFIGPEDKDYVVPIDADALSVVIDRIRFVFEQDGL